MRHRLNSRLPAGWTRWTVFCVVVGLAYLAIVVWAAIALTSLTLHH